MADPKFPPWAPWVAGAVAAGGLLWWLKRTGTIFTIVFENKSASSVIGNSAAPNFTSLANQYGNATNYVSLIHPSLPNYIDMTTDFSLPDGTINQKYFQGCLEYNEAGQALAYQHLKAKLGL